MALFIVSEKSSHVGERQIMATDSTKTEVGSYFISNYPPYSQWNAESIGEVETAMAKAPRDVPLGLYLHLSLIHI